MLALSKRSGVSELPFTICTVRLSYLRSAARKSLLNVDRRNGIVGILETPVVLKLKARLINDSLLDDCCFGQLNTLLSVGRIVSTRREGEPANAGDASSARVVVTANQRVIRIELIIDSGAKSCAAAWNGNSLIKTDDIVVLIENSRDNERLVINVAFLEIQ